MKVRKTQPIIYLIVVALVLSACIPTTGNPGQPQVTENVPTLPASSASLAGTRWALISMGKPGEEVPVIDGSNVTIELAEDSQVSGSGGCNSYTGQYQVTGDAIAFEEIVSTLMACADAQVTAQETQFLQALNAAGRFDLASDRLSIYYGNDQSVLNFAPLEASSQAPLQEPVITDANLMPTGPDEKNYTLTAETGQTVSVEITSDGVPLSLTITTPGGAQRFPEVTQAGSGYRISHTFSATETGEYAMTLTKADQTPSTNYTVTVSVQ